MKRKKNRYNTRLIKADCSYTMQEIASLYGLHKNTVQTWLKGGLKKIDDKKPFLIHGGNLKGFLEKRQAARKRKCKPDQLYCLKCRKPKKAAAGSIRIKRRNKNQLIISGKCETCGTVVNKAGSTRKQAEYEKIFASPTPAQQHITGSPPASVNCHLQGEEKNEELPPKKRKAQMELFPLSEGGGRQG